jgi:hypothetical protein
MAIVKVDERCRMTLPRELGIRETRTVIIPAGSFLVVIPLPKILMKKQKMANYSKIEKGTENFGRKAAKKEAVKRAKRRKQL